MPEFTLHCVSDEPYRRKTIQMEHMWKNRFMKSDVTKHEIIPVGGGGI